MSNAKKWNANIQFPTDSNFKNRIIGADFGPSNSSGNPMLTLECEVLTPEEVDVAGELICIAGVKTKNYFVTQHKAKDGTIDEEKTANAQKNVRELYEKLGLDPAGINWDNIDTKPLLGKQILTLMEGEEDIQRRNPTSAQIAAAKEQNVKPQGDVMINPITKQKIIKYWPKIREIFGLAPQQDGVQVPY